MEVESEEWTKEGLQGSQCSDQCRWPKTWLVESLGFQTQREGAAVVFNRLQYSVNFLKIGFEGVENNEDILGKEILVSLRVFKPVLMS